jgi:thiopeptide-type bacteriocin biosynthesis protein
MYQPVDAVLARAPALDACSLGIPWPDLTGVGATAESWRTWLDCAWQVPEFAVAVEAASPDLARQVTRIRDTGDVPAATVRRAMLSTLRYLLRGTGRATPFGLLAGVAAARIGDSTQVRAGSAHYAVAKADGAWLADAVEALEADAHVQPRLTVVASNLVIERNGHLVIAHRPGGPGGIAPLRVQVRATAPARAVLDAAQAPIQVADLAAKLASEFPAAPSATINALIAQLIRLGFLVTSLRAPMACPNPLSVILAHLDVEASAADSRLQLLRTVAGGIVRHNAGAGPAAARGERHRIAGLISGIEHEAIPALAIDLRLDWDLVVSQAVAGEVAQAAGILARLARHPVLSPAWAAWHARFLDRYGSGAVVPVLDVTSDTIGLGFPAGYLGSLAPEPKSPLTGRDKTLLRLAQRAFMRGEHEVILDDALIASLSGTGPDDPVQPSTELTVRVDAASGADLDAGRFTLHVLGVSRAAATTTGRFLHLLDEADRERMGAAYATLPAIHRDSLTAQVSAAPLYAKTENMARAPQLAGLLIPLGEHPTPGSTPQISLNDLAVTADARRLHLVSLSRRQPVHTILPSAVDLMIHTHPLARFLFEAPAALAAPCTAFDWGAASALPFLPALRHGRTVLSPARWILDATDLPGKDAPWLDWDKALTTWTRRLNVPRHVYVGDGDRCLPLDLAELSHRMLLRTQVSHDGHARLRVAPAPKDLGWADGHPHEITIPLASTAPTVSSVRWRGEVTQCGHGHLTGRDGRLYLKLYAPSDLQDAVLTRRLPALTARLGSRTCWWFIRYNDPAPHLRLRFTVDPSATGVAFEELSAWTGELRDSGLIADVRWETYYPETARFGGITAMKAAEAFFAADSAAIVAQVAASARRGGPDPRTLTAASMTDLVIAAVGDHAEAMRWLVAHTKPAATPLPRTVYDQAVALANEPTRNTGALMPEVTAAWRGRRAALATYRSALVQAGTLCLTDLLPDLLHLHHARVAGPERDAERACLHLARAAALSWLARNGRKAS